MEEKQENKKIKVLELFSGNGDITKKMRKAGIDCISVDYDINKHPDLCINCYDIKADFLKKFDFIWLSPDCATYSLAAGKKHRLKGGIPISEYAKKCDLNNSKLIKLLIDLDIPFICENPRSHFRNMNFTKNLFLTTVYYSSYGFDYEKPTDLFTNRIELLYLFRNYYTKGKINFENANSNYLNRCKMPNELIKDIIYAVKVLYSK